VIDLRFSQECW